MKRILTLMVTIGIIFGLVACGANDEEDNAVEPKETEESKPTEEEVDEEEATPEDGEETKETEEVEKETKIDDSSAEEESEINSEIADFEEASVIEEEIDVSDLDVEIETDNQNNRVILFKDDDKSVYKTIYIKRDQRLKIIDIIDSEGQVYNEEIK